MTTQHRYQALGQWHEIELLPLNATDSSRAPRTMRGRRAITAAPTVSAARPNADARAITNVFVASPVLQSRVSDPLRQLAVVQGSVPARPNAAAREPVRRTPISTYGAMTLATETVIAEGLRRDDLKAAQRFGASVIEEGLDGKVLLRIDGIDNVFGLVDLLLQREVGSVTPNFVRRVAHTPRSAPAAAWSHAKIGVAKAWEITEGNKDIAVAVLDEGVDTTHPALKPAVVAERDFIGGNGDSAMPNGDDAHGTACAGIVLSRDKTFPGIAPRCSLIAARIAMDDDPGHWVFDDFATADAIDWCWRQGAAVLSNSWCGGAPSDAISRAFARARTQGRGGLGSVVAIAAGYSETLIDFPGTLPGYVTVGASNPADERKTHASSDGEYGWGSNFGSTITLLAPGVFIWTTDIVGPAGYDPGDFTKTFNGTSSATPAVAGAAALMMSSNPALSATSVRDLLGRTAKKLTGQTTWTQELGWGRLDVAGAVKAARIAGAATPPVAIKKAAGKKAGAKKTLSKTKVGARKTAPRKAAAKTPTLKKTRSKKTVPSKR